jgi:hypothetical protein
VYQPHLSFKTKSRTEKLHLRDGRLPAALFKRKLLTIGAYRGASPLCICYSSPKSGGSRGLKAGTSQIRLDLRYLTHRWQKAIEDVLIRIRDQIKSIGTS